jgi:hypothetical protein
MDALEDEQHSDNYSLNSLRGRTNIAKWKAANQNIAYTQTDSCGHTYIWMNKERTAGFITRYMDAVDSKVMPDVKVPKGRWSLTSHYNVLHPKNEGILATFQLVKKD